MELESLSTISSLWNSRTLTTPKFKFFEDPTIAFSVRKIVFEESPCKEYRNKLFAETVVLSRFMDERRNKYRNDKGFRCIQKVNNIIQRLYELDLNTATSAIMMNLAENIVPSKQLCQWYLIKLQTNVMLLQRLLEYTLYSASKLQHRLRTGHNWIEVTLALSMISRIWALGKYLQGRTYPCYNKLISIVNKLPLNPKDTGYLPKSYQFPSNLQSWTSQKCLVIEEVINKNDLWGTRKSSKQRQDTQNTRKFISTINSYSDLKRILRNEIRNRLNANDQKCFAKNMDELQWHMFLKRSKKWLKKLRDNEGDLNCIRQVRKKLLKWIS